MVAGDRVLIKQKKTSIKLPFDPKPYTITEVKGTQVTARRGEQERKRNKVKMKVGKETWPTYNYVSTGLHRRRGLLHKRSRSKDQNRR